MRSQISAIDRASRVALGTSKKAGDRRSPITRRSIPTNSPDGRCVRGRGDRRSGRPGCRRTARRRTPSTTLTPSARSGRRRRGSDRIRCHGCSRRRRTTWRGSRLARRRSRRCRGLRRSCRSTSDCDQFARVALEHRRVVQRVLVGSAVRGAPPRRSSRCGRDRSRAEHEIEVSAWRRLRRVDGVPQHVAVHGLRRRCSRTGHRWVRTHRTDRRARSRRAESGGAGSIICRSHSTGGISGRSPRAARSALISSG